MGSRRTKTEEVRRKNVSEGKKVESEEVQYDTKQGRIHCGTTTIIEQVRMTKFVQIP